MGDRQSAQSGVDGYPLPPGEVHLHLVDDRAIPDGAALAEAAALLSEEERVRWGRFHFARHRHQFLVARLLVRTTLSRYAPEIGPGAWQFDTTPHGRPTIRGPVGQTLHFNLSHTQGAVVIAVGRTPLLGVDVEWRNAQTPALELGTRFFAPSEAMALRSMTPDVLQRGFFDLWTLKEAYVKARGLGLSLPLTTFDIGFPGPAGLSLRADADGMADAGDWHLWMLDAGADHALALALGASGTWRPRLFAGGPLVEAGARAAERGWGAAASVTELPCRVLRSTASA